MNRLFSRVAVPLLLVFLLGAPHAAPAEEIDEDELPSGSEILQRVQDALPRVPLRIAAQLQSKTRVGKIEELANAEILLDWHARTPAAEFTLSDSFGEPRARLIVKRPRGRAAQYRYFEGPALETAEIADLSAPIPGMDFSWMDLTLSFLWWPDARTVPGGPVPPAPG